MHFSRYIKDDQESFLRKDRTNFLSQKHVKLTRILPSIAVISVMVHGIFLLLWILPWTSLDSISSDVQKSPILYSMTTMDVVGDRNR